MYNKKITLLLFLVSLYSIKLDGTYCHHCHLSIKKTNQLEKKVNLLIDVIKELQEQGKKHAHIITNNQNKQQGLLKQIKTKIEILQEASKNNFQTLHDFINKKMRR